MTICLNMIVKDESSVIGRCLESLKKIIDYWVIVDTGSTDGTQGLIREILREIPGELHERPWVHFAHNRNEALVLARDKADYILLIDADETLMISAEFDKNSLNKDFYLFRLIERSSTDLFGLSLVKNHPGWVWEGVLHEALNATCLMEGENLKSIVKDGSTKDGNRSTSIDKYLKDASVLEEALKNDPKNSRYVFYLAQSYGNAREFHLAMKFYQKRTLMGGNPSEIFWSYFCIGLLHQYMQSDPAAIIRSFSQAYENDPSRAEPLYQLADHFYQSGQPLIGYFLAKGALALSPPQPGSYFHSWVYEYAALLLFADCAQAIGSVDEASTAYRQLLEKNIPSEIRDRIKVFS